MSDFKDINELLTVARQINEGRYDLINVSIDPNSELFGIAQFFTDSVKKLQMASSTVGSTFSELPVYESSLNSIIHDSKKASEDVLGFIDELNFNIDNVDEILKDLEASVEAGAFARAKGHIDRLRSACDSGSGICFDVISSLEFKEISGGKIAKLLDAISELEDKLARLVITLGLKQNVITAEVVDNLKEPKDILQDQSLVDKLLHEFGL